LLSHNGLKYLLPYLHNIILGGLPMVRIRFSYACSLASLATVLLGSVSFPEVALAQNTAVTNSNAATTDTASRSRGPVDPGVRGGDPGAGGALPGLSVSERAFFDVAKEQFEQVEEVADGLGPRFNLESCGGCHSQPAIGGTSPATNPQVTSATAQGAKNVVPSFITANGPVREARFVRNRDGSPDGGVHALFVITGRSDAPGCNIRQPDFAGELGRNNVVFRIPTPAFGLGLVESVPDAGLEAALAANGQQKRALGISGRFNRSGNDGTITRFGWKAQNKSLLLFSGEAYNVEMGVTNDLFPNERENDPTCQFNSHPENRTPLVPEEKSASPAADFQSDIVLFAAFMRLLAPPRPAGSTSAPVAQATSPTTSVASAATNVASVLPSAAGSPTTSGSSATSTSSTARGRQVFANVGCQACHVRSLTTGKATVAALTNVTFEPLSDFALHDMGSGLADGVSQGNANGREFRTAPLWGVGQRIFFLHDGRTNDLAEAIRQHASRGSEANEVIQNYQLLSTDDKQAMLNYLRSL
jgi:CxxC motif-containing protein (DUF1111 family)